MTNDEIQQLLVSLPTGRFRQSQIVTEVLPEIISWLGYSDEDVRFEYAQVLADGLHQFDAAVMDPERNRPIMVVEIKYAVPAQFEQAWIEQAHRDLLATGSVGAILLTTGHIAFVSRTDYQAWKLSAIDHRSLSRLKELASATALRKAVPEEGLVGPSVPLVSHSPCEQLLEAVKAAQTPQEKKNSLEGMADWLFSSVPELKVKRRNLRTLSSEIDLVVEYRGPNPRSFFAEFGQHILVECKHWAQPVGAREVRDFVGKLIKTKVALGILVSLKGASGRKSGADAYREIRFCFDTLNKAVLVVAEDDLRAICAGASLVDILEGLMDRLRFDLPFAEE